MICCFLVAGLFVQTHLALAAFLNTSVSVDGSSTDTGIALSSFPLQSSSTVPTGFTTVETWTNTVPAGVTETILGPWTTGQTIFVLAGPTTFVSTVVVANGQYIGGPLFYNAAPPTSATQCYNLQSLDPQSGRFVTYAVAETTEAAGAVATLRTGVTTGVIAYSVLTTITYTAPTSISTSVAAVLETFPEEYPAYTTVTYAKPTTIWSTLTADLNPVPDTDPNGDPNLDDYCADLCGNCNIYFPTVNVYYWPVPSPNTACLSGASTAPTQNSMAVRGFRAHPRQLAGNVSTAILDGFTFTSPSAYIAFNTISAANLCGILGSVHTSVTLPVIPGQLSSVILGQDGELTSFSFDFADALCPPASLLDDYHVSFIGQGYRPIIQPPQQITSIDPLWAYNCQLGDGFQGNDPPYALTPAANLDPMTTVQPPVPQSMPADPSSAISSLPVQTSPPSNSITVFAPQPQQSSMLDPSIAPTPSPSKILQPSFTTASTPHDPEAPGPGVSLASIPTIVIVSDPSAVTSNIIASQSIPSAVEPSVLTIGGQSFTANSVSAYVAGTVTLIPGGPAITVSNTPISLAPAASFLVVGSTTQAIATAGIRPAPSVITIDGTPVTAVSASDFIIGSQTLIPGASAITVSGTVISLAPSASFLLVASSTQVIQPAIMSSYGLTTISNKIFTFAGSTYTANSGSDFVIGTQTLVPGAVITVSGTPISLAAAATDVVVGSSTEGLGGMILSVFGGTTPTQNVHPFTGSSGSIKGGRWWQLVIGFSLALLAVQVF